MYNKKKSVNDIIKEVKEIQSSLPEDSKQYRQLDASISDLEQLKDPSQIDIILDRTKKISDILSSAMKIFYEFITFGP